MFRNVKGKTIVASKPRTTGKKSEIQIERQNKFQEAVKYAQLVNKNHELKAQYAQKAKQSAKIVSAYHVAIADYMNPPDILQTNLTTYNGKKGQELIIRAMDDFKVESVAVRIETSEGRLIEHGKANPDNNGLDWIYTVQKDIESIQGINIILSVKDIPGNVTQQAYSIPADSKEKE